MTEPPSRPQPRPVPQRACRRRGGAASASILVCVLPPRPDRRSTPTPRRRRRGGRCGSPSGRADDHGQSESEDVRLHAGAAGVAADGRHRSVLAVLGGGLTDATGPGRPHLLSVRRPYGGRNRLTGRNVGSNAGDARPRARPRLTPSETAACVVQPPRAAVPRCLAQNRWRSRGDRSTGPTGTLRPTDARLPREPLSCIPRGTSHGGGTRGTVIARGRGWRSPRNHPNKGFRLTQLVPIALMRLKQNRSATAELLRAVGQGAGHLRRAPQSFRHGRSGVLSLPRRGGLEQPVRRARASPPPAALAHRPPGRSRTGCGRHELGRHGAGDEERALARPQARDR